MVPVVQKAEIEVRARAISLIARVIAEVLLHLSLIYRTAAPFAGMWPRLKACVVNAYNRSYAAFCAAVPTDRTYVLKAVRRRGVTPPNPW